MDLNFKVNNQILSRVDKQVLVNKSVNYVFCNFEFQTDDWEATDKFVIFKDSWGKAYTISLGISNTIRCVVPQEALKGTHFKISVYTGDSESLITTNELTILLIPSGYTTNITPTSSGDPDIFIQIFEELETKIDSIIYEDGFLRCYADGKLITELELPLIVDDTLSHESKNPVQNKIITNALDGKENAFDFVERLDITIQNIIGREY